ncbi:hypothetical protein, partial [Brachyspira catarrhinii]|uniref:hypothetical protein n=1 Tax=Brachyspira catarrhinii TaxID=2528966 RepID=UPI001F391AE5
FIMNTHRIASHRIASHQSNILLRHYKFTLCISNKIYCNIISSFLFWCCNKNNKNIEIRSVI